MGSRSVADSNTRRLSRPTLAWALGQALRFSIGVCVLSLILATTLAGTAAERFATTGYLAAIAAAIALSLQRILRAESHGAASGPPFPIFFGYSIGVVILLWVVATLVSDPGAEVLAFAAAAALLLVAVALRCGVATSLNAAIVRAGPAAAALRYAVILAIGALVVAAVSDGTSADAVARFAYRLTLVAALIVALSLLAPTKAGVGVRSAVTAGLARLDALARSPICRRIAIDAAAAAVAAIVAASLLPQPVAEPFAIAAYLAAIVACAGVAMECRRLRS